MTTTIQSNLNTTSSLSNGNGDRIGIAVTATASGVDVGNCGVTSKIANDASQTNHLNVNNNNSSNNNNANNNTSNIQNNNSSNSNKNDLQRASESKRKKVKSRNTALPHSGYTKHHLDAWLETCLKDSSNTQLSSSSEFLDYNPSTAPNTTAMTAAAPATHSFNSKNLLGQQQPPLQQSYPGLLPNTNFPANSQPPPSQQQQFALRYSNSQPHMSYSNTYNVPFSQGIQRHMPSKISHMYNNRYSLMFPSGGGSGSASFFPHNEGSQDFASLPPLMNIMGGSSEHENNSTDVLDGSGSNPNISQGFRFSDPCLLNPSDNDDSKVSGQNTPDRRNNVPNDMENNKFFTALMEQINLLHETNSKICRNLHETKVDIEALKHTPNWGMRHRRDSISGLSTHSQPMAFGGGGFGTQSPAPTYHSGAYTPGMMTDVVREVKEAARIREDALLNRVKSIVEERQWSMNECSMRMMRDIEEMKTQIHHLRNDRKEANKRITHLEAENKYMRQMLTSIMNNHRNTRDIIYENEALRTTRKPPLHSIHPSTRRTQSLNLHYGTIHHQPTATTLLLEEDQQQHQHEPLHINEGAAGITVTDTLAPSASSEMRSSFSSSDGGGSISGVVGVGMTTRPSNLTNKPFPNGMVESVLLSPPNFALIPTSVEESDNRCAKTNENTSTDQRKLTNPKQATNEELKQELNVAVAARKEADDRIIALEKMVNTLQLNAIHPKDVVISSIINGDGVSVGGSGRNNVSNTLEWQQPATAIISSNAITDPITPNNNVININHKHHQAHTISSNNITVAQSPPKLSVAGPITDL